MNTTEFTALATDVFETPLKKIPVKISTAPVIFDDGIAMQSLNVKEASDGLKASLLMMMKHCADVHLTILEVISEKYNLDIDEMCNTIKEHPRWTQMYVEPMIHDLTEIARDTACQPIKETKEVKVKAKTKAKPKVVKEEPPKPKKKEIIYD